MNKFLKGLYTNLIAVLISILIPVMVFAAETDFTLGNGLSDFACEVDFEKLDAEDIYTPEAVSEEPVAGGYQYVSEWQVYSNYYIYNQLNETDKLCWDTMDEMCRNYLDGEEDFLARNQNIYCTKYIYHPTLADELLTCSSARDTTAYRLVILFKLANPQYYFLRMGMGVTAANPGYFTIHVYPDFVKGPQRTKSTDAFMSGVKAMIDVVNKENGDYAKIKKIHDLILDKMTYDYDYADSTDEYRQRDINFTQSAYSVFCKDKTVCAGYSQAFLLLCNYYNIPVIALSSPSHEWNMVRLYDRWYEIDLTYDDTADSEKFVYSYFLKSTEFMRKVKSHDIDAYYDGLLPVALVNSNSSKSIAVNPGEPDIVCSAPTIAVTDSKGTVRMNTSTANAQIYYTTDGVAPDPANTKVYIYTDAASIYGNIQAMAVYNGYRYSDIVQLRNGYSVSYELFGAANSKDNPAGVAVNSAAVPLSNPVKKGYIFGGWFTTADFKDGTEITEIPAGLNRDIVIYAKWNSHDEELNNVFQENTPVLETREFSYNVIDYTGNRTGIYYFVFGYYTGFDYTGKRIKPQAFLYDAGKKQYLKAGKDFSISYANNKNAGEKAKIVLRGKGFYNFVKDTEYFKIYPITFDHPSLSLEPYSLTVKKNNKAQTKGPVLYYDKIKLKKSDYTVKFTGNIVDSVSNNQIVYGTASANQIPYGSLGTYEVELTEGKSHNIVGSIKTTMTITDKVLASKFKVKYKKTQIFTNEAIKPYITVSYKKLPLTEGKDYTVSYLSNIQKGSAYIIVRGKGDYSGVLYKPFKIK